MTGDIANKGLESEYKIFYEQFLYPLQELLGDDIDERTFSVPGNHDVNRNVTPGFSSDKFLNLQNYYFDVSDNGKELRAQVTGRFEAYCKNDSTQNFGEWITAEEGAYYFVDEQRELGIIGINTAWLCEGDEDKNKLSPGKHLVEKALKNIKDCKIKVVLGHHPLDWFAVEHKRQIEALFGKNNVIYLHGHLHDNWITPQFGSGQPFLAIQSGAAFQAREDDVYKNGLLWAKINLEKEIISLQPRSWNKNHQDWSLAIAFPEINRKNDFWHFDLPGRGNTVLAPVAAPLEVPGGWSIKNAQDLLKYKQPLEASLAIRYFDGAIPSWHIAASSSIPKRKIVFKIADYFIGQHKSNNSIIVALIGAGCEGKSTAILQSAFHIVTNSDNWLVLRRGVETNPLVPEQIIPLLLPNFNWLILIDDAENLIDSIVQLVKRLPPANRGRVHFLLASRDSDWQASNNQSLSSIGCTFYFERLSGLQQEDAQEIVKCWRRYGDEGLGELKETKQEDQVSSLLNASKRDINYHGSAFFGALLTVRYGNDLKLHAAKMMERLSKRIIPTSGRTLLDAISYISAMDAAGFSFLSRSVLAYALNCPEPLLRKYVLQPLGEEAAATTSSDYVYTRHPIIAQTVLSVLTDNMGEETDVIYIDLVNAALSLYKQDYVLDLASWRYKIADAFADLGRKGLALSIVNTVRDNEPNNAKIFTKVLHIYRRAQLVEKACEMFEKYLDNLTQEVDRRLFEEWAITERMAGNYANSAMVSLLSFSDQLAYPHRLDGISDKFQSLGYCLKSLYFITRIQCTRELAVIVCLFGMKCSRDAEQTAEFEKNITELDIDHTSYSLNIDKFIERMYDVGIIAHEYITSVFVKDYLDRFDALTFIKLKASLKLIVEAPTGANYLLR
ncbi:metallophosphoesterase family protein [Hymenobacter coccineus]|uniref:metallophosphoesterase family protein n=1 Tax=Hymenobacter coccineus TaxID=1908235 RepID=UPI0021CDBDE6|nr:metallophosphoesterase [Hymenobacter coccineus]